MKGLEELLSRIEPADKNWEKKAWDRLHSQIRPRGSLGDVEIIAARLAAVKHSLHVDLSRKILFVMADDHGIATEGVRAYPQEVTARMVYSFTRGWASINVLAEHAGAEVRVVNCGVASELPLAWDIIRGKIGNGTASIISGPAMTRDAAEAGSMLGARLVTDACSAGGLSTHRNRGHGHWQHYTLCGNYPRLQQEVSSRVYRKRNRNQRRGAILNLNMRLGEGAGSALAMNIVEAAAKVLVRCKTFAEAGVMDAGH